MKEKATELKTYIQQSRYRYMQQRTFSQNKRLIKNLQRKLSKWPINIKRFSASSIIRNAIKPTISHLHVPRKAKMEKKIPSVRDVDSNYNY